MWVIIKIKLNRLRIRIAGLTLDYTPDAPSFFTTHMRPRNVPVPPFGPSQDYTPDGPRLFATHMHPCNVLVPPSSHSSAMLAE